MIKFSLCPLMLLLFAILMALVCNFELGEISSMELKEVEAAVVLSDEELLLGVANSYSEFWREFDV